MTKARYPIIEPRAFLDSFRDAGPSKELLPREYFYVRTVLEDGSEYVLAFGVDGTLALSRKRIALYPTRFDAINQLSRLQFIEMTTGTRLFNRARVRRLDRPQYN